MSTCDYEVSVKLVDIDDGATVIFDLSNLAAGYGIVTHAPGDEVVDSATTESPFVNGDFAVWEKDSATRYSVTVRIKGDTWAQVEARREALRTAYRSDSHYLLDVTLEGVTRRYRARRPNVSTISEPSDDLLLKRTELLLTFPVQPNPTVTGV